MTEQSMSVDVTVEDFLDSLTGFDEIAIEKAFGGEVIDMMQKTPSKALRSLVFIQRRREGMKDADARTSALEMRLGDVQAFFPDDDEVTPDEPATDAGKGDSRPG